MHLKKMLVALGAISLTGIAYAGSLISGTDTTTFTPNSLILSSEMNDNFDALVTEINDNDGRVTNIETTIGGSIPHAESLNTRLGDLESTLGGTIPTTPTFDSRVTDLETVVDNRTVVSLLDYPLIYPYKSTDGAGVGVPGTPQFDINYAYNNDSGPGLQAAMQDAIDRHLVLEFPANQLFYVRTPIVLYVGGEADEADQQNAINDHQGFVIRGNHSKIWVPQGIGATPAAWSTLNGPLITIMGRNTIAQWNNPSTAARTYFTSTIRDLEIYLQGHYGEDPHRDMYALQIGDPTGTNATYSDNHLFIEGLKLKREVTNQTPGSALAAEGDGYYNNALVRITNANLLTFENGSVIGGGGISLEATSGNVTGSIWIRGNDIRGPSVRKDSGTLGGGLRYAPGIEDAAPNSARAIGLSAETGGQVASVYVHENQIYYAGIGMHLKHGSSIHDITFTGNEFDIGVDSTPFIHADIEPAPTPYISEGQYYNIHIHNNDLSVPFNSPAFVFEGTDSPAGSGPDWVGAGNPGFEYGYTGLVIQGNHVWSGNAYDPSTLSIDSPAYNDGGVSGITTQGALVHFDESVHSAVVTGNMISQFGGTVDPAWTSMMSIEGASGNITFADNVWSDNVRTGRSSQLYIGALTGSFPSQAPASMIRLSGTTSSDLNLTVTGNSFPDGVPVFSFASPATIAGNVTVGNNTTDGNITVASANKVYVATGDGAFHNITGTTRIENFVIGDGTVAPPAGHKFTVQFANDIEVAHEDATQAAGQIVLSRRDDTEFAAGDVVEFISDGSKVYEKSVDTRDFVFANIDPDPTSIKSMHDMTSISSEGDGYIDNFRLESPYHARTTAITSRWAIDGEKAYCTSAGWGIHSAKPWYQCPATNEGGAISYPATLKTKTTALNLEHVNATASEAHALAVQLWSAGDTDPNGIHVNLYGGGGSQTNGDEGANILRLTMDDSTHTPSGFTNVPNTISATNPATLVTLPVQTSGGSATTMGETASKGVGEGRLIVFKPTSGYITSTGNTIQPPGTTVGGLTDGSFPPLLSQSAGYGSHDGWWYITGADPTGWESVEAGWCMKDDRTDYTPTLPYVRLTDSAVLEDSAMWLYISEVGTWNDNGTTRRRFKTEWFAQGVDKKYPPSTLWSGNYTFAPCAHVVNPIYDNTTKTVSSIEVFKETSWTSGGVVEFYVPSYGDMPFQGIALLFDSKTGAAYGGTGLELYQLLGNSGPGGVSGTRSGRYAMETGLKLTTSGGAYNGEIQIGNNSLKDGKYHPWGQAVQCEAGACKTGIFYDYYDYHQTSGSSVIELVPPDNPAKAFGGLNNCLPGGKDIPGGAPAGGGTWGGGDGLAEACWGNGYGTANYMNVVDVEGHEELDLRLTRVGWGTGRGHFPVIGSSVSAVAFGAAKDGQAVVWDDTNQYHKYAPILTNLQEGTPTTDQVLKWNGSAWAPGTDAGGVGSDTLSGMTDTGITSPAIGEALVYNSVTSNWENKKIWGPRQTFTASGGGGAQASDYATAVVHTDLTAADGFAFKNKVVFKSMIHHTGGNFQRIIIEVSHDNGSTWVNSGLYYNFYTQKANGSFTDNGSNASVAFIRTESSGQSITGIKELSFEITQPNEFAPSIQVDGMLQLTIGGNTQLARVTGFINTTGTSIVTNRITNIRVGFGAGATSTVDPGTMRGAWSSQTYAYDSY